MIDLGAEIAKYGLGFVFLNVLVEQATDVRTLSRLFGGDASDCSDQCVPFQCSTRPPPLLP